MFTSFSFLILSLGRFGIELPVGVHTAVSLSVWVHRKKLGLERYIYTFDNNREKKKKEKEKKKQVDWSKWMLSVGLLLLLSSIYLLLPSASRSSCYKCECKQIPRCWKQNSASVHCHCHCRKQFIIDLFFVFVSCCCCWENPSTRF